MKETVALIFRVEVQMETTDPSETLVTTYQTIHRHNTKYHNLKIL
jgi:hypothetical protein